MTERWFRSADTDAGSVPIPISGRGDTSHPWESRFPGQRQVQRGRLLSGRRKRHVTHMAELRMNRQAACAYTTVWHEEALTGSLSGQRQFAKRSVGTTNAAWAQLLRAAAAAGRRPPLSAIAIATTCHTRPQRQLFPVTQEPQVAQGAAMDWPQTVSGTR